MRRIPALLGLWLSACSSPDVPTQPWSVALERGNDYSDFPPSRLGRYPVVHASAWSLGWGSGRVPSADRYWAVVRAARMPDAVAVEAIRVSRRKNRTLAGILVQPEFGQGDLAEIVAALTALKPTLPAGVLLSVGLPAAWFTQDVSPAIGQADEFVVEFFGVSAQDQSRIVRFDIDPAQWGPRLARFGKPYRIALAILRADTPAEVKKRVESARRLGPWCVGVVFHYSHNRPAYGATDQPDESLMAAGLLPFGDQVPPTLITSDGDCAAVHCTDLALQHPNPLTPNTTRYRVRTSAPLDRFEAAEGLDVRVEDRSDIVVTLGPYAARSHIHLGRAVSLTPARFTVESIAP